MKRSQKFMLLAILLIFLAHFFDTVKTTVVFNYGYGPTSSTYKKSGWSVHPWYIFVPLLSYIAYVFFTRSPKIGWYWAVAVFIWLFHVGLGVSAFLGIVAAFYSIYLKRQEQKQIVQ